MLSAQENGGLAARFYPPRGPAFKLSLWEQEGPMGAKNTRGEVAPVDPRPTEGLFIRKGGAAPHRSCTQGGPAERADERGGGVTKKVGAKGGPQSVVAFPTTGGLPGGGGLREKTGAWSLPSGKQTSGGTHYGRFPKNE